MSVTRNFVCIRRSRIIMCCMSKSVGTLKIFWKISENFIPTHSTEVLNLFSSLQIKKQYVLLIKDLVLNRNYKWFIEKQTTSMLLSLILFNVSNERSNNLTLYSRECIAAVRILTSTPRNIALRIELSMIGQYLKNDTDYLSAKMYKWVEFKKITSGKRFISVIC